MTEPFRVGLIGCGTVGSGVLEILRRRQDDFQRLLGRAVTVTRVVVRRPEKPRHHVVDFLDPDVEWTTDAHRVTRDAGVDLVVEVAGGRDTPRDWMVDALAHGRDVVTANKAALAFHGSEIFHAARQSGRTVYYEASVAAAIPIIEMLQHGLIANQVTRLSAILNGTCNYILTRMELDHLDYATALKHAQEQGFAEADPTLDVSGQDAAHKLALLAGIVSRSYVPVDQIYTEGIESIALEDIEFAKSFNYRIKLLAIAKRHEEGPWELRVHATLIPRESILAQVMSEFNAVYVKGHACGPMLVYGKGAGSLPTASSVVADIVRAARGERPPLNCHSEGPPVLLPIQDVELRNYIRMTVRDVPGVLGRITSFLGMKNISISSIHQPDAKVGQPVPVVLVTHRTADHVVSGALKELEKVQLLLKPATRIRIEE